MSRPADLRAWIARIESLGELQHVSGANWDLEIGTISEINYRRKPSAALLFDNIVGYPRGYRVLTGSTSKTLAELSAAMGARIGVPDFVRCIRARRNARKRPQISRPLR